VGRFVEPRELARARVEPEPPPAGLRPGESDGVGRKEVILTSSVLTLEVVMSKTIGERLFPSETSFKLAEDDEYFAEAAVQARVKDLEKQYQAYVSELEHLWQEYQRKRKKLQPKFDLLRRSAQEQFDQIAAATCRAREKGDTSKMEELWHPSEHLEELMNEIPKIEW